MIKRDILQDEINMLTHLRKNSIDGICTTSNNKLAQEIGFGSSGDRNFKNTISNLQNKGDITMLQKGIMRGKGEYGQPYIYRINNMSNGEIIKEVEIKKEHTKSDKRTTGLRDKLFKVMIDLSDENIVKATRLELAQLTGYVATTPAFLRELEGLQNDNIIKLIDEKRGTASTWEIVRENIPYNKEAVIKSKSRRGNALEKLFNTLKRLNKNGKVLTTISLLSKEYGYTSQPGNTFSAMVEDLINSGYIKNSGKYGRFTEYTLLKDTYIDGEIEQVEEVIDTDKILKEIEERIDSQAEETEIIKPKLIFEEIKTDEKVETEVHLSKLEMKRMEEKHRAEMQELEDKLIQANNTIQTERHNAEMAEQELNDRRLAEVKANEEKLSTQLAVNKAPSHDIVAKLETINNMNEEDFLEDEIIKNLKPKDISVIFDDIMEVFTQSMDTVRQIIVDLEKDKSDLEQQLTLAHLNEKSWINKSMQLRQQMLANSVIGGRS